MIEKTILHYKILKKIGKGGMGVVYKAEDIKLGRLVALKFLSDYSTSSQEDRVRLGREARAAALLKHESICTIFGFHETNEQCFIAMEYVEGETLKELIHRKGSLSQKKAIEITQKIAEALSIAHQKGIVHRDIKSDNIMIKKDGIAKIMDFGLAKLENMPTITRTKSPMGTVGYMSPEQVQGFKVDHRSDLWSLGVVLFEMLTGALPFKGDSDVATMYAIIDDSLPKLSNYNLKISNSIQYVFATLLEKNVALRYQKAENVLEDLKHTIKGSKTKLIFRKIQRNYKKITIASILILTFFYFANYYYQAKINIPPWLKKDAKLIPLIDENGPYDGVISPSGKYLAYRDRSRGLGLKNIITGENRRLRENDFGTFWFPTWSPDESQIAYVGGPGNNISIVTVENEQRKIVLEKHEGNIYYLTWSPNGKLFCYLFNKFRNNQEKFFMELYDTETTKKHIIFESKFPAVNLMTWYPDASQIAFYYYDFDSLNNKFSKFIKLIDVETKGISALTYEVKNNYAGANLVGFCYSPDGRYLVIPEKVNNFIELVALPVTDNGKKVIGKQKILTNFAGTAKPYRPCFTKDGKSFSFNVGKHNEDIFIASIDINQAKLANRLIPACVTKFVEGNACWIPNTKEIVYTTDQGGKNEIFLLDLDTHVKKQLTDQASHKNQLSISRDKRAVTYISDDILWQANLRSGQVSKVFPSENEKLYFQTTAYHSYAWAPHSRFFYGLLKNDKNKKSGQLMKINLQNREVKTIFEETISLPYSELRLSNDGRLLAVRTELTDTTLFAVKIYNTETWKLLNTFYHVSAIAFGEISWTPDNLHFTYGAWDDKAKYFMIYLYSVKENNKKLLIERRGSIRDIPGQISPNGKEMIYYKTSFESEIWLRGEN